MNQTAELARRAFLRLGLAVPPFILAACAAPAVSPTPTAQSQAAAPRPAGSPATSAGLPPSGQPQCEPDRARQAARGLRRRYRRHATDDAGQMKRQVPG